MFSRNTAPCDRTAAPGCGEPYNDHFSRVLPMSMARKLMAGKRSRGAEGVPVSGVVAGPRSCLRIIRIPVMIRRPMTPRAVSLPLPAAPLPLARDHGESSRAERRWLIAGVAGVHLLALWG